MPATLKDRYAAAKQAATDIHDTAKAEDRPLTDDERSKFDNYVAEANTVREQIDRADADAKALAALEDVPADTPTPEKVTAAAVSTFGKNQTPTGSWGDQFIASQQYSDLLAQHGGKIPAGTQVTMNAVEVRDIVQALITDPGLENPATRVTPAELAVVDLFSAINVIENSPQSVKTFTATWTDATAEVAEGALKPEASLAWADATITLVTLAQHVPITNQALAHNPTLRSRIDTYMVNGIRAKMQSRVADALAASTGVQTQAFDTDLRTTVRKALTKAQTAAAQIGAGPASILISAIDAETLDLEAMAAATISNGDGPNQVQTAWRTPLVVSGALPSGFIYVGDARQIELYTAGGINITTGWINDQFIKNSLTLLGETEAEANLFIAPAIVKAATSV